MLGNNPVVLMLKPDVFAIQEIKIAPSKSKITDMVAIRHNSGTDHRTTLILLCEDGSLKIYLANIDQTGGLTVQILNTTVYTEFYFRILDVLICTTFKYSCPY